MRSSYIETSSTKVGQYASTPWPRKTMYVCFSVYPKLPHGTPWYPILLFIDFQNAIQGHSSFFKNSKYFEDQQTDKQTDRPIDMTRYRCFLLKHKNYISFYPYSIYHIQLLRLSSILENIEVVFQF